MANRRRQSRQRNPYEWIGALIILALVIVFIASFWQIIIGCIITFFVVYILWRFRDEVCRWIASIFRFLGRFISWSFLNISNFIQSRRNATQNGNSEPKKELINSEKEK